VWTPSPSANRIERTVADVSDGPMYQRTRRLARVIEQGGQLPLRLVRSRLVTGERVVFIRLRRIVELIRLVVADPHGLVAVIDEAELLITSSSMSRSSSSSSPATSMSTSPAPG
jgi:hypothetical protein